MAHELQDNFGSLASKYFIQQAGGAPAESAVNHSRGGLPMQSIYDKTISGGKKQVPRTPVYCLWFIINPPGELGGLLVALLGDCAVLANTRRVDSRTRKQVIIASSPAPICTSALESPRDSRSSVRLFRFVHALSLRDPRLPQCNMLPTPSRGALI